jgi:hypothetical protein
MATHWMDVEDLSLNHLLLFEADQLAWLPGWHSLPRADFAAALRANPVVAWYLCHKCPQISDWIQSLMEEPPITPLDAPRIRAAELAVLRCFDDLLTYAVDPVVYDRQPFTRWDDAELTALADFSNQRVLDIGAGTGRLALVAARAGAETVFAVEPVTNLRRYLTRKARQQGYPQVYAVDGLITCIPFPDHFADLVVCGHVFGDEMEAEYAELHRVCKPAGSVILCPANDDVDNERHAFLLAKGFSWARFEEPGSGWVRKYWLALTP